MRRMSFALTTAQIENRTKTVTRRKGWTNLKPGDRLLPVLKCMGLKKGEKHTAIGTAVLEVVSVRREPLAYVGCVGELAAEGFTEWEGKPWGPAKFASLYCKANGGDAAQECTRIEFRYLEVADG